LTPPFLNEPDRQETQTCHCFGGETTGKLFTSPTGLEKKIDILAAKLPQFKKIWMMRK